MTVYVESNFVLEQALEQEQSDTCFQLVGLARQNRIGLVIPAFSLVEPHESVTRKGRERSRLANELRVQLSELGRSKAHQDVPQTYQTLGAILSTSLEVFQKRLRQTVLDLLAAAEVISLDIEILAAGAQLELSCALSGPDAIVLASVLMHLRRQTPAASCFLNKNSKDFDNPSVGALLDKFGCKYFARFDHGLSYITSKI